MYVILGYVVSFVIRSVQLLLFGGGGPAIVKPKGDSPPEECLSKYCDNSTRLHD